MGKDVTITLSNGGSDLAGIIALQRANLETTVGPDAALREGYVTVGHTRAALAAMHALCPSVVARVDDEVVGYALVMPVECRAFVPILEPMFEQLAELEAHGVLPGPLTPGGGARYYVMGQICIAQGYRGRGLFDALYAAHRAWFSQRWQVCVTDVALRNTRSLRAHERVGFRRLLTYRDATDSWALIGLWLTSEASADATRGTPG